MTNDNASPHAGALITILKVQPYGGAGIAVVSDALDVEGRIDSIFSADGDDISPPLGWSAVLEADTFALIVEDPDAAGDTPAVHWMMWNIPGKLAGLSRGVEKTGFPDGELEGAVQGANSHGVHGWMGPKPPAGTGKHRYHIQLFALSTRFDHLGPETPLEELTNALKGTTIAHGELVGTFEAPELI